MHRIYLRIICFICIGFVLFLIIMDKGDTAWDMGMDKDMELDVGHLWEKDKVWG
jgi:hypothetical protein